MMMPIVLMIMILGLELSNDGDGYCYDDTVTNYYDSEYYDTRLTIRRLLLSIVFA